MHLASPSEFETATFGMIHDDRGKYVIFMIIMHARIQYPSLARIIHTTHLTVVEGAPSSRNLGKAVCVLCFIWCTHSLSGVLFQSVVNKHGTKVSGLHVCKSLYEVGDLLLGDHLTHQSK